MAEYRAYIVGQDDHFIGIQELVCGDDKEAVAEAKQLLDGHDIEVWSGDRLVIRLGEGFVAQDNGPSAGHDGTVGCLVGVLGKR